MKRSEGGQGGRKGHSNMEHWSRTERVKEEAKVVRRANDIEAVEEGEEEWDGEGPENDDWISRAYEAQAWKPEPDTYISMVGR